MLFLWKRRIKKNVGKQSSSREESKVSSGKMNVGRNKETEIPVQSVVQQPVVCLKRDELLEGGFASHIMKYIGQTVTIFVVSGGVSGSGFTGILMTANRCYIRLLTRIGTIPSCSLGNSCFPCFTANYNYISFEYAGYMSGKRFVSNMGSVANIPIDKIVSFVHNTV